MKGGPSYWFVIPENPVPWTASATTKTSTFKGGRLEAYQNAIKEELASAECPIQPPYYVKFYFFRRFESGLQGSGRRTRGNQADATNMQKATEDALQGILFDNDREVREITSEIVEMGDNSMRGVVVEIAHWNQGGTHTARNLLTEVYLEEGAAQPVERPVSEERSSAF